VSFICGLKVLFCSNSMAN